MPKIGSQFVAVWAKGNPHAYTWTVRDITEQGVYITSGGSRSPGNLIPHAEFLRDYVAKDT